MGSDPALFFDNLFLYFYEIKWMDKLKKNVLIKARKLCNIFRFIDDLNSISDGGEFERKFHLKVSFWSLCQNARQVK